MKFEPPAKQINNGACRQTGREQLLKLLRAILEAHSGSLQHFRRKIKAAAVVKCIVTDATMSNTARKNNRFAVPCRFVPPSGGVHPVHRQMEPAAGRHAQIIADSLRGLSSNTGTAYSKTH